MFKSDCPHPKCRARASTFTTTSAVFHDADRRTVATAHCGVCHRLVMFVIRGDPDESRSLVEYFQMDFRSDPFGRQHAGGLQQRGVLKISIERTYPDSPTFDVPASVPENVASAYVDGLKALDAGLYAAAAFQFRQSLERAVRQFVPEGSDGLKARIRRLDAEHQVPAAVISLAHTVRAEGNLAVHEENWTADEARRLAEFARLLFVYIFTLPAEVAAVASERGNPAEAR